MRYPLQLTPFSAELAIYIPDYEQVKEVYEAILIDHPAEPFPYWAKLWPSSIALVQYLKANTIWIEHKNVLEIGAGLGLPSFMIAGYANSVQVSDYAPEAVELLEKNIQHLQLNNVQAMELDWNRVPDSINADVVLLSDVNYNPSQFDGLLQLITKLIAEGTIVILSTPQRIMASPFVNAIQPLVKQTHVELVNENGNSIEISILVLSK
ncbi:MAG: hypothetical protein RL387_1922 [Bacteroidota bacterium]|jgi:predicted nicotinamide N-methyase